MNADDRSGPEDAVERAVQRCYSSWGTRYYEDYYGKGASYPPVHLDVIADLLRGEPVKRVLDAGCGPASVLRHLIPGVDVAHGFDLTPEMVAEARRVVVSLGKDRDDVWIGSVLDSTAFTKPGADAEPYDLALCVGVLPHIPPEQDAALIRNLIQAVRPGGRVVLEARNALFALFTLNRYSHAFFRDHLIGADGLTARAGLEVEALQGVLADLETHFRTDLPPRRQGDGGDPGYDDVLSRLHHPLVLLDLCRELGLDETEVLFYHHHALPPMFEARVPELFRRESLALEASPRDWRGLIMASAFLVVGRRR